MPKYAVAKGRKPGIYDTWGECQKQVSGVCDAKFKKFDTRQQAEEFLKSHNVVLLTLPENVTHMPTPQVIQPTTAMKVENLMAPRMNAVPKVSPSDTKLNTVYQAINSLEEKISKFMDEMGNRWANIEHRVTAIEKQLCSSSSLGLQETIRQGTNKRPALNGDEHVTSCKIMRTTTTENISSSTSELSSEVITICESNQQYSMDSFILTEDGYVVVYTDGACSNNGKYGAKAGLGVWFNTDHSLNVAEPVRGYPTNNNAEIQAAIKAINQAYAAGIRKLDIHTDSQFMIKCITSWINKWKRNNWVLSTGGSVKNKDELIVLDNTIKKMEAVRWTHVRGHRGILGNTKADELARRGAELFKTNVTYGELNND